MTLSSCLPAAYKPNVIFSWEIEPAVPIEFGVLPRLTIPPRRLIVDQVCIHVRMFLIRKKHHIVIRLC